MIDHLTKKTLETLEHLPVKGTEAKPPPSSNDARPQIKVACRTSWQCKWLGLDVRHPDIQVAADKAEKFCGRFYRKNTNKSLLVIGGRCCTGKSHIARCIYRWASQASFDSFHQARTWGWEIPGTLLLRWPEIVRGFKQGKFDIVDDCFSESLLVLDDIGAEQDPWKDATDILCQIMSRREMMFTVVTTNIMPEAWKERFDGRIEDRLCRNSDVVDLFTVPSYPKTQ